MFKICATKTIVLRVENRLLVIEIGINNLWELRRGIITFAENFLVRDSTNLHTKNKKNFLVYRIIFTTVKQM